MLKELEQDALATADPSASMLAESLAANHADAHLVFSEPVDREGITVIPVAKVRYMFGGHGAAALAREHP